MKLHFVEDMDQVLKIALEGKLPELKDEQPEALGTGASRQHRDAAAGCATVSYEHQDGPLRRPDLDFFS